MIQKSMVLLLIGIFVCSLNLTLEKKDNKVSHITWNSIIPVREETPIMKLSIPTIHLQGVLYAKDSNKNTVEQNISFLVNSDMPDKKGGNVFIAAHSGTGHLAYFKNLDKVELGDTIELYYQGTSYLYQITNYEIQEKTGKIYLNLDREGNHLILTTCMPHQEGKQLIILAQKRESI